MTGRPWVARSTPANHEKKVGAELGWRRMENFLPLYSSVRRWKDRNVRLQMPLFPGYGVVHLALNDRVRVHQGPGVAKLAGFGGLRAPRPDGQPEALRPGFTRQMRTAPHPSLPLGRR